MDFTYHWLTEQFLYLLSEVRESVVKHSTSPRLTEIPDENERYIHTLHSVRILT